MSVFDGLDPTVQAAARTEGFREPTEAQRAAIPLIAEGKNVLLIAPTGSGKTEAAILPIFDRILSLRPSPISALYITPLRALNRDILKRIVELGEALHVEVAVRHGDTPTRERTKQSKNPPDLLITTPETLQAMLTGRRLREHLGHVRWVVVDEIHEFVADERGAQLSIGLERLRSLSMDYQRIGLSATVGSPGEVARFLVGPRGHCNVVKIPVAERLSLRVESPPRSEDEALAPLIKHCRDLIESRRSTLLFVNTREAAEVLAAHFRQSDYPLGIHHSSLSREARLEAEDRFKSGDVRGIICTSSMELGIDVGSADLVIQYDSPRQVTRLTQRVGRAGHRVGEVSEGVVLASMPDEIAEAAVIARRALAGMTEEIQVPEQPLDVLANQLIGMTMGEPSVRIDDALSLMRGAYPFRRLDRDTLMAVLRQLAKEGLLWMDSEAYGKRRGVFSYYFENLSMIPDESTYRIMDVVTKRSVGKLDEGFVVTLEQDDDFICKGMPWRVVSIQDEGGKEVLVEPSTATGTPPHWVGEEIPVPFEVAQEVGRLRRELSSDPGVLGRYPLSPQATEILVDFIRKQGKHPMPTDEQIVVEGDGERIVVINACLGSKVNLTLGYIVSSLLSARFGASCRLDVGPYRVMLEVPRPVRPEEVKDLVMGLSPGAVRPLLDKAIGNSSYLRWRMLHVARRFGVLPHTGGYSKRKMDRLVTLLEDTPVYAEVVREIHQEKLDITRTMECLERVREGELAVVTGSLSPIGLASRGGGRGLMLPELADGEVLKALKQRLEGAKVMLCCVACGWTLHTTVSRLRTSCPRCGSVMIAVLRPWDETPALLKKKKITVKDRGKIKTMCKNASLMLTYGPRAAIALAARGVGPDAAARILMREKGEEGFLRDVLRAEVQYARTRRFWD